MPQVSSRRYSPLYKVVHTKTFANKVLRLLAGMDFDGFGIGGSFTKEDMGKTVRVLRRTSQRINQGICLVSVSQ